MVKAIEDMTPAEKHAYAVLDCFTNTYWPTDLKVMATQFVYVTKADGKKVATVYGIEPVKYDTAHLFAAAPDLFAACKLTRDCLAGLRDVFKDALPDTVVELARLDERITAAMLKARGCPIETVKIVYDTSGFSAVMDVVADDAAARAVTIAKALKLNPESYELVDKLKELLLDHPDMTADEARLELGL